jgi:hypothetical protein
MRYAIGYPCGVSRWMVAPAFGLLSLLLWLAWSVAVAWVYRPGDLPSVRLDVEPLVDAGRGVGGFRYRTYVSEQVHGEGWLIGDVAIEFEPKAEKGLGEPGPLPVWEFDVGATRTPMTSANRDWIVQWREFSLDRYVAAGRVRYTQQFLKADGSETRSLTTGWIEVR